MSPAKERPTTPNLPALTVADLDTEVNCEPRILDTVLGEHLGMAQPRNIRAVIEANVDELATYEVIRTRSVQIQEGEEVCTPHVQTSHTRVFTRRVKTSAKGGRPSKAYYLTEGQALCVCALSRAPNAPQVRRALIEAFMELRQRRVPATVEVKVREHRRRPPETALPRTGADGQGAVLVDGVVVRFDARRKPAAGELAIVLRGDGTLVVMPIPAEGFGRERAAVIGAVVKGGPAKPAGPPMLPGRVSERLLRTYASWLHMEYGRLCEEIERQGRTSRLGVGLEITNPGFWYHKAAAGEILEPPSARAALVLKAVGCPIPVARPPDGVSK